MDNVAHAIVGAAMGRAVGGARVPFAGTIGAVAANAPDWTELFFGWPWPRAQYLALHRGVTHSIAGVVVETVALTVVAFLLLRGIGAARRWTPAPLATTLALVAASVASHPIMDWQGSYGWRPLLPWNGRWYYGDFVAIADAWYWLIPLVALAWGARRRWQTLVWYGAIWLATTLIIFLVYPGLAAPWVRVGWLALSVVGAYGWVGHWFGPAERRLAAAASLGVLVLYASAQALAGVPVKTALDRAAAARFGPQATSAALTVVGRPFFWQGMIASRDSVAGTGWSVPRHLDLPVVQQALRETADGRDVATFARFLAAEVDSSRMPWVVALRDVRYAARGGPSWASVTVPIAPDDRP